MNTIDAGSEQNESKSFNSIEEMEEYFDQMEAKEKQKWGLLYPVKIGIRRFVYNIDELRKKIVWAFQRAVRKHHAADIDLWSFHYYIAKKILPKLEAFRNQKFHSIPSVCNSPVHCVLPEETDKQDKTNDGLVAWLNLLDETIYAFSWDVTRFGTNLQKEKEFYQNYFGEDVSSLDEDYYSELRKKASDRAQEGFELFGKYFTCLWD
jgi:hypothetical protein